jgi:hypothetical protein
MNRKLSALWVLLIVTAAHADDASILRCRKIADSAQRLECYDAVPVATTSETTPRPGPDNFGLERKKLDGDVEAIESSIAGHFEGWVPNQKIQFANGQVWQISDDSKGFLSFTDPKIKVRRGVFGAFYLEIQGTKRTAAVRSVSRRFSRPPIIYGQVLKLNSGCHARVA